MVNRLRGRARGRLNQQTFLALDSEQIQALVVASHSGLKWRKWEGAILIASGAEEDPDLDASLAVQLGRTPSAVRARRAKLKKQGKL